MRMLTAPAFVPKADVEDSSETFLESQNFPLEVTPVIDDFKDTWIVALKEENVVLLTFLRICGIVIAEYS